MKALFFALIFTLVICLGSALVFVSQSGPVNPALTTPQPFMVNKGDGIKSIALRLEKNGFIKNQYIFIVHAYLLGLNQKLQAGAFELSPSLSADEIAQKLSQGGHFDVWVKIIDGWRNEEIAQDIEKDSLFSPKNIFDFGQG